MKTFELLLTATLLSGTFASGAGPVLGAEGIISKVRLPGTNYCHLRFPAIRGDTLDTNHPVLKDPSSGDIIDFYGPCDHDPLGMNRSARREMTGAGSAVENGATTSNPRPARGGLSATWKLRSEQAMKSAFETGLWLTHFLKGTKEGIVATASPTDTNW